MRSASPSCAAAALWCVAVMGGKTGLGHWSASTGPCAPAYSAVTRPYPPRVHPLCPQTARVPLQPQVRELHVYGTAVAVHARDASKFQHQVGEVVGGLEWLLVTLLWFLVRLSLASAALKWMPRKKNVSATGNIHASTALHYRDTARC